jgi:pimeloyl-ACP methyl ester carboxylesterase
VANRAGSKDLRSAAHLKASAAATQAALPHSDIVELPGQGHAAMDTAPQLFLDEVIRFFT